MIQHRLFESTEFRVLSWKQPYASLMLHGKIETRTWSTNYRGPVLICASKAPYAFHKINNEIAGPQQMDRIFATLGHEYEWETENLGVAIAVGHLVNCRRMKKEDEDKCFVAYRDPWQEERISKKTGKKKIVTVERWCHIYENVRPIEQFPWEGSLAFRSLTEAEQSLIKYI